MKINLRFEKEVNEYANRIREAGESITQDPSVVLTALGRSLMSACLAVYEMSGYEDKTKKHLLRDLTYLRKQIKEAMEVMESKINGATN